MSYNEYRDPVTGKAVYHDDIVDYLSNPMDQRTWEEFCTDINVSRNTVFKYRMKFKEEISKDVEYKRRKYMSEMRSVAYRALLKKLDKDTNALKLFFQLSGDLVERSEQKVEMLTAEEKRARATSMLENIAKKIVPNKVIKETERGPEQDRPQ